MICASLGGEVGVGLPLGAGFRTEAVDDRGHRDLQRPSGPSGPVSDVTDPSRHWLALAVPRKRRELTGRLEMLNGDTCLFGAAFAAFGTFFASKLGGGDGR